MESSLDQFLSLKEDEYEAYYFCMNCNTSFWARCKKGVVAQPHNVRCPHCQTDSGSKITAPCGDG